MVFWCFFSFCACEKDHAKWMGGLRFCHINKLGFRCRLMPRFCFFGWWICFSAQEKDHAKWIGGFMELFVATNYLFRQIQENECTLLRWINLGTCKGPSQSMYERKLFACFVCHIKISQTTRFLVTFLILLESLRWIKVHQVSLIMFWPMVGGVIEY
jgi:hypothetical protein